MIAALKSALSALQIGTRLGFLGSAKPTFIDTSLLGNVRISITLAPGTILQNLDTAVSTPKYTLSNQFFIETLALALGG